ncbi:MAG: 50S ribosomal protein L4 [Firmicutes bacterium]|nr:50S ribosomal protein L4 [Bacillota bacterium]MBQ1631100.1 50S ribosomal protein L4 [Bacillota bacterium]
MAQVTMLDMQGANAGNIELNDEIFAITPNEFAVHAVVKNYLANQRQGTQSAKTRGEVRGGGRKPFRQKGTGRHRQGHSTDPSQVGGGVVFAPKPRDYRYTLPKKLRRLAMKSALSSKVAENEIIVVNELKFDEPKTKEMIKFLEAVKAGKKALIVMAEKDENVVKSARNIPGVRTALATTMNVYEIINHESFIVTEEAVKLIEEVYK